MNGLKSIWRRSPSTLGTPSVRRIDDSPATAENAPAEPPPPPVTVAIIGAGQRGRNYAEYALKRPDACAIIAVAEPRPKSRAHLAAAHGIPEPRIFHDWRDLLAASTEAIAAGSARIADAVVVAVQDSMHLEVVQAFAAQGYHILCEKPMATSVEDCLKMYDAVTKAGVIFGMGHVLRYSPYSKEVTAIVRSGALGQLINVVHVEPVGYYHFAHSYVRGHWNKERDSAFSLMTKSCHDIDILCHWLMPQTPTRVSSFGSLTHFRRSAKPAGAGAATRCLDCPVERECPYSAKQIYLAAVARGSVGWPASTVVDGVPDIENITEALQNTRYGACVYELDNDVCDHQVVNLEFSDGATASFTMVAHTSLICERQTRLHFSHGELVGDMTSFTVTDYRTRKVKRHTPRSDGGGHGGGDLGLIGAFVEAVRTGDQSALGTDIKEVLKAHITVFAAERSRREGRVVDCAQFEREERERLGLA